MSIGLILPVLLNDLKNLNKILFESKFSKICLNLLICEYPIVRKVFFEEFYLLLILKGEDFINNDILPDLIELLSNTTIMNDNLNLKLFEDQLSIYLN